MLPSPHISALPHGTRLRGGEFVVGSVIGSGGFGITYRGGDTKLRRLIAIKEFFPYGSMRDGLAVMPTRESGKTHAERTADFLEEATTLARFNHPGIVRILAAFEENNTAYMVMELLEGQTLAQLSKAASRPFPEAAAVRIMSQIAGALDEVHRAGLLHRDITPDNIILTGAGTATERAVLIDFGTARDFTGETEQMTQAVTPGYAPLEQYARHARRTPASDIYGLGATLYHLLTGQMPTPSVDRVADVPLPPMQELNPRVTPVVAAAVMNALELEAARRPQSTTDWLELLSGQKAIPTPPDVVPSSPPAPQETGEHSIHFSLHHKLERHVLGVSGVMFSPDSRTILSTGNDKNIYVWNPGLRCIQFHLTGHELGVTCGSFSPDGSWVVSGSRDKSVRLWSVKERRQLAFLHGHSEHVAAVAFSPKVQMLVSGGEDGVLLWNTGNGTLLGRLEYAATSLAFSPAGGLYVGASDGTITAWDTSNGTKLQVTQAHAGEVRGLTFSPNGDRLASVSGDRSVKIWDVTGNALAHTLEGHGGAVNCVAFHPGGVFLATGGDDDMVRIWNVFTGMAVGRQARHKGRIHSVAFSPDGQMFASASADKTINFSRCKVSLTG